MPGTNISTISITTALSSVPYKSDARSCWLLRGGILAELGSDAVASTTRPSDLGRDANQSVFALAVHQHGAEAGRAGAEENHRAACACSAASAWPKRYCTGQQCEGMRLVASPLFVVSQTSVLLDSLTNYSMYHT